VLVVIDVVNVTAAHQPVVQAGGVFFDTTDARCKHEDYTYVDYMWIKVGRPDDPYVTSQGN